MSEFCNPDLMTLTQPMPPHLICCTSLQFEQKMSTGPKVRQNKSKVAWDQILKKITITFSNKEMHLPWKIIF